MDCNTIIALHKIKLSYCINVHYNCKNSSLTILASGAGETALMKKEMSSGCYSSSCWLPLAIISSSSSVQPEAVI